MAAPSDRKRHLFATDPRRIRRRIRGSGSDAGSDEKGPQIRPFSAPFSSHAQRPARVRSDVGSGSGSGGVLAGSAGVAHHFALHRAHSSRVLPSKKVLAGPDDYAFQRNERGVSARPFVVPCVILFVSFFFASRARSFRAPRNELCEPRLSFVQETRPLNVAGPAKIFLKAAATMAFLCAGDTTLECRRPGQNLFTGCGNHGFPLCRRHDP